MQPVKLGAYNQKAPTFYKYSLLQTNNKSQIKYAVDLGNQVTLQHIEIKKPNFEVIAPAISTQITKMSLQQIKQDTKQDKSIQVTTKLNNQILTLWDFTPAILNNDNATYQVKLGDMSFDGFMISSKGSNKLSFDPPNINNMTIYTDDENHWAKGKQSKGVRIRLLEFGYNIELLSHTLIDLESYNWKMPEEYEYVVPDFYDQPIPADYPFVIDTQFLSLSEPNQNIYLQHKDLL